MARSNQISEVLRCYHCGEDCDTAPSRTDGMAFCCEGCKLVYEILRDKDLCSYYRLTESPGTTRRSSPFNDRFRYLDDEEICRQLLEFRENGVARIVFSVPAIHCSSCIYLLENLHRLEQGVISARVDFIKREVCITFDEAQTSLRRITEAMASVGYEPRIRLDALGKIPSTASGPPGRRRLGRLGVAGFCFGNIMMLSFPEYLSGGKLEPGMAYVFSYLTLVLALPVFFYSASEFLVNAWAGIRQRSVIVDLPIAIGILAMFSRSTYEILSGTGPGYFDSMAGLVFFMLAGRQFQDHTFRSLLFDRDYKAYFPLAVTVLSEGLERPASAFDLKANDRILIRSNEILPADGILEKGPAHIDYSFVTGESAPVEITQGDRVYAGGRLTGSAIEIRVTKTLTHSRITRLWKYSRPDTASGFQSLANSISRWFVAVTMLIALTAAGYWMMYDDSRSLNAFTSVLVIACACALTLSPTYTYGSMLRQLGRRRMFFRDAGVLQKLADIDTVVFDKTGTLTTCDNPNTTARALKLDEEEKDMVRSLARHSSHPVSMWLVQLLPPGTSCEVSGFHEQAGQGIEGTVNGRHVKIGNAHFAGPRLSSNPVRPGTYISIDGEVREVIRPGYSPRPGIKILADRLKRAGYKLAVLTGDHDRDRPMLTTLLGSQTELLFCQSPTDKFNYIMSLQENGGRVLMIGDGLNDAGALRQSDAGITISSPWNNFTAASDGIIDGDRLGDVFSLLRFCRSGVRIIYAGFVLSLLYNVVGLSFAVQGTLSPVLAAILMPVSTVSLVLFAVTMSAMFGRQLLKNDLRQQEA